MFCSVLSVESISTMLRYLQVINFVAASFFKIPRYASPNAIASSSDIATKFNAPGLMATSPDLDSPYPTFSARSWAKNSLKAF